MQYSLYRNLTQLTFDEINQYDTSPDKGNKDAVQKIDKPGVESLITNHSKHI